MAILTKAAILAKITTLLADNTTGDISEADIREVLTDIKDSLSLLPSSLVSSGTPLNGTERLGMVQGGNEEPVTTEQLRVYSNKTHLDGGGVVVKFNQKSMYGEPAAPEVGDINDDVTDAEPYTRVMIIHQDGTPPNFPAKFKLVRGAYDTTKLNFIECIYINATLVIYTISNV